MKDTGITRAGTAFESVCAVMRNESRLSKRQSRSVRVVVGDLPVRIGGVAGHLVNISATGALARVWGPLSAAAECTMEINTDMGAVALGARVVRSGLVPDVRARIDEQYVVAIAFGELHEGAQHAVQLLCGDAYARVE